MEPRKGIFKLKGKVQQYAWGGKKYIPGLLGIPNETRKPYAEYWMGAHPSAAGVVVKGGKEVLLNEEIAADMEAALGKKVSDQFKELPYLFKILDVNDMLSIQVHPTKEEAEKGFLREDAEGVPLNAPHRNYKDKNHKPEVMVALSDFWLLHGFKVQAGLLAVLKEVPEFNFLSPVFEKEGYYGLYKTVMELPQQQVDDILKPLVKRVLAAQNTFSPKEPGYWVSKLYSGQKSVSPIDRGIFSIYFFNIMELAPGEAVFQGAGIPHAYLQGQNVELMANSDNVLRGGLTPKHIDVPELLKHTLFKGVEPAILKGVKTETGEETYNCPVEDFGISAIRLQMGGSYTATSSSAEIFIVIDGKVAVNETELEAGLGESFVVFANVQYTISALADCLLYKAFVP